jgi:WhiB family transcriptional regulator, redox-sensing transcriptional regulator
MTERQRRAFVKQHPEVDSWSKFFASKGKPRNAGEQA